MNNSSVKTFFKQKSYKKLDIGKKWIDVGARRIVQIGHGAIGGCMLELYNRHIKMDSPDQIIVFEMNKEHIPQDTRGHVFKHVKITKSNYMKELSAVLRKGDMLVDLAWYISTLDLVTLCHNIGACFVNAAVELWDIDQADPKKDPREYTLYARQMEMQRVAKKWGEHGSTCVLTHGANPGWVSHTTKWALKEWIKHFESTGQHPELVKKGNSILKQLQKSTTRTETRNLWAKLAELLKVQVIHVSERDTLVSNIPRQPGTFVCTWSPQGFIEEGMAPAELGWGTHETLKDGVYEYSIGPKNQVCFATRGMNTLCQTFVPSGNYVGMVVRHEEAYSISDYLTVRESDGNAEQNRVLYRPTVHYAYYPCSDAVASMYELQSNGYAPPEREHVPRDDCVSGLDELGCFLLSRDYGAWWIGTVQSIEDSRELLPGQSPTILVVAAGVLGAVVWTFLNPDEGLIHPEEMDDTEVMSFVLPYLDPFISGYVSGWKPFVKTRFDQKQKSNEKDWTFQRLSAM
jgi:homospermidine synthase